MRSSHLKSLLLAVPMAGAFAQTPTLQVNVVYQCQPPLSMEVFSCTGASANDQCDVLFLFGGRPFQRGKSPYQKVMTLLPTCHRQTPAEAQIAAQNAAAPLANAGAMQNGAGAGGFKVGDTVRVLFDGWQVAKILEVHGGYYVVSLPNGIQTTKQWPVEVRRVGKLTPEDHAAGQYDVGDRVQVLVNGRWMAGEVRGQNNNMYDVKVPGIDTGFGSDIVNTTADNIRM